MAGEIFSYGTKKVLFGEFNVQTGELTAPVEVAVYKDSVDNQESDPPETKHYQEGKTSPALVVYGNTDETFKFSVMDAKAATAVKFLGGTVTTVNGKSTWNKGTSNNGKKAGFQFETEDGCVCTVYGTIAAKRNNKLSSSTIRLIDVTITPVETGTAIPSVRWDDPVED